jgi:lipopolysaccharide biosynthesis glycosyltransferase
MKITIPSALSSNIKTIESVWFEAARYSETNEGIVEIVNKANLNLKHIEVSEFVEFHDDFFKDCSKIRYRVLYKNGVIKIYKFDTKHQATYRLKDWFNEPPVARHKISSFADSEKGRKEIFEIVNKKIVATNQQPLNSKGSKNLVYYSVYFDTGYLELLNSSITSILNHSTAQFDLLLITDAKTKSLIENLPFTEKIKPLYHITPTPLDGVEASINKLNVFDYAHINTYDKILFLDCDIIAIGDINNVFSSVIRQNTLYTAYNLNLTFNHFKSIHHGFDSLDEAFIKEMKENNQMPFNAGQFLFRNSNRMKEHFDNTRWMVDNWSGEYFFEQSFMNYYFSKAHVTNATVLQKYVSLTSTATKIKSLLGENIILVHFIIPPLNAPVKLQFINEFLS